MHKPKTFSAEAPEVQKRRMLVARLRAMSNPFLDYRQGASVMTMPLAEVCALLQQAAGEIEDLGLPKPKKLLTAESVTIEIVAVGPVASGKTQALAEVVGQIIPVVDDDSLSFVPNAGELHRRVMVPLEVGTENVSLRAEVRHNDHAEVPA